MSAQRAAQSLILACTSVAGQRDARDALSGPVVDWDEVMRLATRHGVRPLVYQQLQAGEAVPEQMRSELARHYQNNVKHNLLLTSALVDLIAQLASESIEAVPFKGPALAEEAYGSLALREFNDLDVLVPKRDAVRAIECLQAAGYVLTRGHHDVGSGYHRSFVHPRTDVLVELHWGVTQEFLKVDIDLEAFWSRSRTLAVAGRPLRTFSPEDTLILLCIHGAKHLWLGLNWIRDVAGLLAGRSDIAWEELFATANRAGCGRMVQLGLYLAHDLLESPLPEELAADLRENAALTTLAAEVTGRLFSDGPAAVGLPERYGFYRRVRERRIDRSRLRWWLVRLLFTPIPEDRDAVPLPRPLHWLYPLVRPARLLGERWRRGA